MTVAIENQRRNNVDTATLFATLARQEAGRDRESQVPRRQHVKRRRHSRLP